MRGTDHQQSSMFSYISAERRVPKDHPLRALRVMADGALAQLGPVFDAIYARSGRPSIAPEKLLRALLLQVLYTVRSERLLMEQLDYNFLFRWFVGLSIDDPVWDATVFTKNRERLLEGEVAEGFFTAVVDQARAHGLLSDEHFTVDGTLIEAWAGHKSFKRKDESWPAHPARRSRQSQRRLSRRATQQRHPPIDHRSRGALGQQRRGQGGQAQLRRPRADGEPQRHRGQRLRDPGHRPAEPQAAMAMVEAIPGWHRITLGADKGYDRKEFVAELRDHQVTPHLAAKPLLSLMSGPLVIPAI